MIILVSPLTFICMLIGRIIGTLIGWLLSGIIILFGAFPKAMLTLTGVAVIVVIVLATRH